MIRAFLSLALLGCSSRPDALSDSCSSRRGTLVAFSGGVTNAAFVGETLYFDSDNTARISRVALAGGDIETLVDSDATGEWGAGGGVFAWDTEPVHATPESPTWVDQLHIRDAAGRVHDLPPATNGGANQLQVDSQGNVYWLPSDTRGVARWDHAAGGPALLSNAAVSGRFFADDQSLYWLDGASISTLSIANGAARTLATLDGTSLQLVGSDAQTLYLTQSAQSFGPAPASMRILAVSKSGGAPVLVAESAEPSFANFVTDERYLYWVTAPAGTGDSIGELDLVRAAKNGGGAVEKLASDTAWIAAIGVDDCNLYTVTVNGLAAYPKP